MREIKFRAWDKKLSKYHYFEGIFNKRPYTEHSTFVQYESSPEYHDLVLEQFTGLKDNGKEIYEGDAILPKGNRTHYFVKWCNNGWKLRCGIPKNSGSYIDFNHVRGGQIIGNIYENPELL